MSSINQRIEDLVQHFALGNNSRFALMTGTSEANVRNYRKETQPKFEFICAVANQFEINYEWLLTGKGQMIGLVEKKSNKENEQWLFQAIDDLKKDKQDLRERNADLKERNTELKEINNSLKEKIKALELQIVTMTNKLPANPLPKGRKISHS